MRKRVYACMDGGMDGYMDLWGSLRVLRGGWAVVDLGFTRG